jgi:hypothetical protein
VKLDIMLRDCALDWYMILDVNSPPGVTRTIANMKKLLINEFLKHNSKDQYMNNVETVISLKLP